MNEDLLAMNLHESTLSRILSRILVFQTAAILERRYLRYDFTISKMNFLEHWYSELAFLAASPNEFQCEHAGNF